MVGVTHQPDHFGPMTWHRCIAPNCQARVDPWDHNTRCPQHRPADDETGDTARTYRRNIARAIVAEHRRPVSA